ncbi:hypothetical protein [Larkinella soli]|uniref:hypothetical protein n=1 Tax=Larkinella soli TaxID=1770527 RepID=UPI000FFBF2C6|nr:hypothetical protein [Larkinella soli]
MEDFKRSFNSVPKKDIYRALTRLFCLLSLIFYTTTTFNDANDNLPVIVWLLLGFLSGMWYVKLVFLLNFSALLYLFTQELVNTGGRKNRKILSIFALWIPVIYMGYNLLWGNAVDLEYRNRWFLISAGLFLVCSFGFLYWLGKTDSGKN